MYSARRTTCGTLSAADAFTVIHVRRVVFDRNRTYGANLLALHTAYTADLALFSRKRALVMVFTRYRSFSVVQRQKLDKSFGASVHAFFTGSA